MVSSIIKNSRKKLVSSERNRIINQLTDSQIFWIVFNYSFENYKIKYK